MAEDYSPLTPPADPWPQLAELRARCPVTRFDGQHLSLVTTYTEARAALRNPSVFSSRVRPKENPEEHSLVSTDPPDHTRLRKLINGAFPIERVRRLEPRIREIAHELLDAIDPAAPFDLVRDFTVPLPVTVIAELLGVDLADRAKFKRWSDDTIHHDAGGEAVHSYDEFRAWAREQIVARRAASEPADDLLTAVARAEADGRMLSEGEAASMAVILVIAGNETTTNALGTAIHRLLGEPGLKGRVVRDRGLIPNLVEETVRFDPPITALPRKARSETALDGVGIPGGETVLVHLGAANRDPGVFDDPDRFDIDRETAHAHIGFGYGPHTCVGAPLARAEMAIGIDVLLERMPGLRLIPDRDPGQIGFFLIRGPSSLWVETA